MSNQRTGSSRVGLLLMILSYHCFVRAWVSRTTFTTTTRLWQTPRTLGTTIPSLVRARHRLGSSTNSDHDSVALESQRLAHRQSQLSQSLSASSATREADFVHHQSQVFDAMADQFPATVNELSPELVPIYRAMVQHILDEASCDVTDEGRDDPVIPFSFSRRLLDVACGTGILWPFLMQLSSEPQQFAPKWDIVGLDLSHGMVQAARRTAQQTLEVYNTTHSITVVQEDMTYHVPIASEVEPTLLTETNETSLLYDVVVANACFGNVWNQTAVLAQCAHYWLKHNGILCVTHPLGADFVDHLHSLDPLTVPHRLPKSRWDWYNLLATLPLELETLRNPPHEPLPINGRTGHPDPSDVAQPFYMAVLRRVRARTVDVMRLRGAVASGFGRGSKKLGFATANLPNSLHEALQNVATGVYFGWAVIEGDTATPIPPGRNMAHKAVVNIGYSPTFVGQENPVKIVEAHLILTDSTSLDPPDFYGETMRLQLVGFLRPEQKFPSFPDLIAQIRQDVTDASQELDREPYRLFEYDAFIQGTLDLNMPWVGKNGGNVDASWETEPLQVSLQSLFGVLNELEEG